MENKELVKYNEEGTNFIVNLKSASTSYCSLNVNTQKEKEHLFNIISSPTDRIANMINEIIELKDLYVETVELTNEETGEITFAPRTILIDKNGNIRCRKDNYGNPIIFYDGLEKKGVKEIQQDIAILLRE